jgi:hypothetical protein
MHINSLPSTVNGSLALTAGNFLRNNHRWKLNLIKVFQVHTDMGDYESKITKRKTAERC